MAENNNTENSNIAEILQAIINGSSDYPDFKDNPPSRIALLLMLLGNDISAIKEIVANLPDPLVPQGNLGTGEGDLPDLPDNPSIGDTYFVATAGTYGGQSSHIGDMFYFNASEAWSYVPTGDIDTWRNVFVNNTEVHGINNKDALKLVDSDSVKVNYDGVNKAVSFEGLKVKTLTYTGNGASTNEITFPVTPKVILSIQGRYMTNAGWLSCDTIIWGVSEWTSQHFRAGSVAPGTTVSEWAIKTEFDENKLTITGSNADNALNVDKIPFTVCYI